MNNYILLLFNPIHTLNTRYLAKVFGVVRDNGQAIMAGCDSNENVKIAYSQTLFGEALTDFSVITYPISKWQYRKCRFYLFRLLLSSARLTSDAKICSAGVSAICLSTPPRCRKNSIHVSESRINPFISS